MSTCNCKQLTTEILLDSIVGDGHECLSYVTIQNMPLVPNHKIQMTQLSMFIKLAFIKIKEFFIPITIRAASSYRFCSIN